MTFEARGHALGMKGIKRLLPFRRNERDLPVKRAEEGEHHPLVQMRQEMDQMFDRFLRNPFGSDLLFGDVDRWFGDFSPNRFVPSVDISDEKKNLRITMELPGLGRDDIELEIAPDHVRVHGEKKTEETSDEGGYYRTERAYGSFERVIPLPVDVDADRAEASFESGVLSVKLPKVGGAPEARRIPIRGT